MKMNHSLSEVVRGEWLLDVSGQRSVYYSQLALNMILGNKKPMVAEAGGFSMKTLYDKNGRMVGENHSANIDLYGKVNIFGEIIKRGDYCALGSDQIVADLDALNDNDQVKGIILEIDSPGGSVGAAGVFKSFSKRKKKPVVVLVDMACSLGYLAAITIGDRIFADNDFSARLGSIGVVCSFITPTEEYFKEKNVRFHEIYPEESKDKNGPFIAAKDGDYDLIKKSILSPMALKFQDIVKEKRPNLKLEEGVLTGATFNARQSVSNGLIDGISDLSTAIKIIQTINHLN